MDTQVHEWDAWLRPQSMRVYMEVLDYRDTYEYHPDIVTGLIIGSNER
jgi:hypothetical protein